MCGLKSTAPCELKPFQNQERKLLLTSGGTKVYFQKNGETKQGNIEKVNFQQKAVGYYPPYFLEVDAPENIHP